MNIQVQDKRSKRNINFGDAAQTNQVQGSSSYGMMGGQPAEVVMHASAWAIRRVERQVKCMAYLASAKSDCGNVIPTGSVAPSVMGVRVFGGNRQAATLHFCGTDVTHSWTPKKFLEQIPAAPLEWSVARGTSLTDVEYQRLQEAGFVLKFGSHEPTTTTGPIGCSTSTGTTPRTPTAAVSTPQPVTPSNTAPTCRDGKSVRQRSSFSAPVKKRLQSATQMKAKIYNVEIEVPGSREVVYITNAGNNYLVTISQEPHCTCPDFAKSLHEGYMVCKHILFVFQTRYRLQPTDLRSIQPTLSDKDVKEILARS